MVGLMLSAFILLSYYVVALLDLWELTPTFVQIGFYSVTILASLSLFIIGFMGLIKISPKAVTLRLGICGLLAVVIALINIDDISRLTTFAIKPRALFDYSDPQITATLTPPIYLQKQSFSKDMSEFNGEGEGINPVHEGSVLDVQIKGLRWAPVIKLSDGTGAKFDELENGTFKASIQIDQQTSWSIKQGSHLIGSWPIILLDDEEPVINKFTLTEFNNDKGYLAFDIDIIDDTKIMNASVEVIDAQGKMSETQTLSIRNVKTYDNLFFVNFIGSEFEGSEVDIKFNVEDEAGQKSSAVINDVLLPEKVYNHEIASKLISLYNELKEPGYNLRSLSRQINALGLLSDDQGLPPVYYMALRSAYWRLVDPTSSTDQETARNLLWDTAQKLEDSELGSIENRLLSSLDELTLTIKQKKPMLDVREGLRKSDQLFREYIDATRTTTSKKYTLDIDIQALRKIYSYILAFSDQEKHYSASLIVDFMRKGLVQNDDLILSKEGLGNYFILSESRQIIDNLIAIQKTLLASSYNDQMQGKLVKANPFSVPNKEQVSQIHSQIILQRKVGNAVKLLGEKISFAGDNSGFLIQDAEALVETILSKMKKSETNQVAQSQSELITVMSNLKRVLNKPIASAPELQNIIREINSQPVL